MRKAAGLRLGGHQIHIAAGVDPGGQRQVEGNLGRHLIREL